MCLACLRDLARATARGRDAQASDALHGQQGHGRALGADGGRSRDAHDRGRARGSLHRDRRRFAVIDVGTNSVKFHVGEREPDGSWRTIADRAEVTRLGEGLVDGGRLGAEPISRTVEAIGGMAAEADRDRVQAIAAVGTAGMRIASNAHELVDAVREQFGVEVEVIPGEEEARLADVAATSGLGITADRSSCSTPAEAARSSPSAPRAGSRSSSA